ncbi:hypothetical protein EVAR_74812_1 [Eumeta japonica]|uniref:Uncharacterized protein n=1 Tax=Eumeta variegata TaxID=151549 RepID=A0A4C1SQ24_EUMVA|nr:hypothetical protein EVAR_74812_1 [Eumeta japonica]
MPEVSPVQSPRSKRRQRSLRVETPPVQSPLQDTAGVQFPRPIRRRCSSGIQGIAGAVPASETPPVQAPRPRHRWCAVSAPHTPPVVSAPRHRWHCFRARNFANAVPAPETPSVQSTRPRRCRCSVRVRAPSVQFPRSRHRRPSPRRDVVGSLCIRYITGSTCAETLPAVTVPKLNNSWQFLSPRHR